MYVVDQFGTFFSTLGGLVTDPSNLIVLILASLLGILFGALPGLTATLGVALLTTLTYGMPFQTALIALLALYVGAIYGGSYPSVLVNIPGTAASAATAMDGYPMAQRGEGGRALGLSTTASFIGTVIGMMVLVIAAPLIARIALQFTSYEFFLLAFFGIIISGTLTSGDLAIKGWIAGLLGLALSAVGRDQLQFYPRYTFDIPALDSGIEVVPVLIGAFAIPQIIKVLSDNLSLGKPSISGRIVPGFGTLMRNGKHIARSSMIGVGIGAVPGIGEDIAGWVSYGAAKNSSKHPETFGTGEEAGLVSSETANNACVGGHAVGRLNDPQRYTRPDDQRYATDLLPGGDRRAAAGLAGHVGQRHSFGPPGGQAVAHAGGGLHAGGHGAVGSRLLRARPQHIQPLPHGSDRHRRLRAGPDGLPHRPVGDRRHPGPDGRRELAPGIVDFARRSVGFLRTAGGADPDRRHRFDDPVSNSSRPARSQGVDGAASDKEADQKPVFSG